MKTTIIGCGHGGQALAAHLTMNGCDVTLYADESHPGAICEIKKTRQIKCYGKLNGVAEIKNVTTNTKEAVAGAEVIFLVLPTNAHETQFEKILPYLSSGQIVVALAANFTSLYLSQKLRRKAIGKEIIIADISSLPYACRAEEPGLVNIIEIKDSMGIATIPAGDAEEVKGVLQPFFPTKLVEYKNVIELGMNITSGISHPTVAVLNAGRINSKNSDFYFYKEGISSEIAQVIEQLYRDRQYIGSLYDVSVSSYLELMSKFYGIKYNSILDFVSSILVKV
ncbi:MAG: NAD/NADP octopine/nopaline dehydrogenase family protein [Gammaproteobacteria bacterium]|nr:NAD/NADP octopine/nopaline dehydrogenase family protein [Gammaproteobacteria bacterium]